MTFAEEKLDRLKDLTAYEKQCVYGLVIAGDRLLDPEEFSLSYYRAGSGLTGVCIHEKATGENRLVSRKGSLTSLDVLAGMENLQELVIAFEPLRDLKEARNLTSLRKLTLINCDSVVSLADFFSLPNLEEITVSHCCYIQGITGIDRLKKLTKLELSGTQVKTLSALAECDFRYAEEQGGFSFRCFDHQIKQFSWLKNIPVFRELAIEDGSEVTWTDAVKGAKITSLHVRNWQKQLSFATVMMNHEELARLTLENCTRLTNLGLLEDMPKLLDVYLTKDMTTLAQKLQGKRQRFSIHILEEDTPEEAWTDGDETLREIVHESGEDNYY